MDKYPIVKASEINPLYFDHYATSSCPTCGAWYRYCGLIHSGTLYTGMCVRGHTYYWYIGKPLFTKLGAVLYGET